ncbi:S9 family peptidase [bacterium]|nr:S9 family peptidase [bacterium]
MLKFCISLIFILSLLAPVIQAGDNVQSIQEWLTLGPMPAPLPHFADSSQSIEMILNDEQTDMTGWRPAVNQGVTWIDGHRYNWEKRTGGDVRLPISSETPDSNSALVVYTAAYVESGRRQTVNFRIEHNTPALFYLDGKMECHSASEYDLRADLDLHTGKHLLVIKSIRQGEKLDTAWYIGCEITSPYPIEISVNPQFSFAVYDDYALIDRVSSTILSPDGTKAAMVCSHRDEEFKTHNRIEVYDTKSRDLIRIIDLNKNINNPKFTPEGDALYFRMGESDGTAIWRYDLSTGETKKLLGPVKGLKQTCFSKDGKLVYFTADGDRNKLGTDKYTLMTDLTQRLTDWTDKRQIYAGSLEDGTIQVLTGTGDFAVDEIGLSPEGDKLVFTRRYAIDERPFFMTEFWLLDLLNNTCRMLLSQKIAFETRPLNLTILPGGENMLYTAASHLSSADDVEPLPHVSEVDIYMMNITTGETKNITGDTPFTPCEWGGTESSLMWNAKDKSLYFPALKRGFIKIMKVNPFKPLKFEEMPAERPFLTNVSLSYDGTMLAYTGSSLSSPDSPFIYNLKKKREYALNCDLNKKLWEDVKIGEVESYDFVDSKGYLIDGWLIYPPDFDSSKKYPLICYYYAGVSPLDESFYYAYHFWAANGYIVYALTPVGAIAHGDEFASYHVNDWGEHATQDIIEGVEKLIAEKGFIDSERMGCYGASYGGFTTMDLITKTDMFSAAVAMYGISNIASYWGGGTWGYTYGDIALAQSYPWKSQDVFVEKSPLFHADKINTPLLLLHSASDVNVPSLESDQMFTALRVQGKETAYVKFPGHDHGIAGDFEIYSVHREMMLEWWDKHLKDQSEGWNKRWGF